MTETSSASETASSQPLNPNAAESPLTGAQAMTHTLADLRPVVGEIAALVARGDAFLNSRDITSARLFYERAANAGSGLAALQLGATFDPVIVGRSGTLGVIADPAQALSWYRRARDLGMAEAAHRIKRFESPSLSEQDARSPLK
jgi:TPR repeat protein